jgi:hypothetical protein
MLLEKKSCSYHNTNYNTIPVDDLFEHPVWEDLSLDGGEDLEMLIWSSFVLERLVDFVLQVLTCPGKPQSEK